MERFCNKSMRTECIISMCSPDIVEVPSYQSAIDSMAVAENGDGWLSQCVEQDRYIVLNQQFLQSLADFLNSLESQKILQL